ncbi:SDR family oxidoreductase [Gordonia sp. CPCC 206044]|uniref:SDR family oxidoreductase n=1 Tax=Gordonia sp. CPCC 206044 TaxID=3140793 RepID=UPI003AF3EA66
MGFTPQTLADRVVIVSGAARGMGAEHARAIVEAGGRVVLGDVDVDGVASVAETLGDSARSVALDVTDPADWQRITDLAEDFGRVGGLVNNAGIFGAGSAVQTSLDEFRQVQAVNVEGSLLGIAAVAPAIRDNGGGSIVNISSVAGLLGIHDHVAYVTSKWAVRGLTRSAALDLGPWAIRVNSVHPGRIVTPFIDGLDSSVLPNQVIREAGVPRDISALVVFLLSEHSRFSTGSEFIADGGRYLGEFRR